MNVCTYTTLFQFIIIIHVTIILLLAGVTVSFERPSYTFTENGVTGSIEVIKTGVASTSFDVLVSGGIYCVSYFSSSIILCT